MRFISYFVPASWAPDYPVAERLRPIPNGHPALKATSEIVESGVTGITAQFRENASTYDERYFDVATKVDIIERALKVTGLRLPGNITALDIGCGSGSATFAILEIFKASLVYSTDLSPELLTILAERAAKIGILDRITPFVANAATLQLSHQAFDLIVGSSMLHHLPDPQDFLARVLTSVRPGGLAIFIEPFQAGYLIVRQLLSTLVRLSSIYPGLSEKRLQFFRDYIFTINTMFRDDRDTSFFDSLDDKWNFTRKFFQHAAERSRCNMDIFTTNSPKNTFRKKIATLLHRGLGDEDPLPDWVTEILDECDAGINMDLREELLMEGAIVFTR